MSSESPITHPVALSYSSDHGGQTGSPVGQMKVESLLEGNSSGSGQKYNHSLPNQLNSQPPPILPPSSCILVPPPSLPNRIQPMTAAYTQPYAKFDQNVAGLSTQRVNVNIPYYSQQYEHLYGDLPTGRQSTMGWTPAVYTWGGRSGFRRTSGICCSMVLGHSHRDGYSSFLTRLTYTRIVNGFEHFGLYFCIPLFPSEDAIHDLLSSYVYPFAMVSVPWHCSCLVHLLYRFDLSRST